MVSQGLLWQKLYYSSQREGNSQDNKPPAYMRPCLGLGWLHWSNERVDWILQLTRMSTCTMHFIKSRELLQRAGIYFQDAHSWHVVASCQDEMCGEPLYCDFGLFKILHRLVFNLQNSFEIHRHLNWLISSPLVKSKLLWTQCAVTVQQKLCSFLIFLDR